jgi:hypothetical protein
MLHILNGDSARVGLERSGIPGDFVVWPDVLHEGRTPLATGEEWIAVRARELAGVAGRTTGEIAERYRRDDAALESFRDHDEVIFWFEHDLFDQLLLVRHLWWLKERGAVGAGGAEGAAVADRGRGAGAGRGGGGTGAVRLSLVCRDVYLGPLTPDQFPPLFAERQPITGAQIELGSRVWRAFCGEDPTRLLPFAASIAPELPFLAAALRRFLEDYPSSVNGLTRTEQQILRVLSERPLTKHEAFRASMDLEEAIYLGDLSFFNILAALESAPHPLLIGDGKLHVTDTGRDVMAARADHVALNGIDRWMGGVHLTPERHWRWTGSSLLPATA